MGALLRSFSALFLCAILLQTSATLGALRKNGPAEEPQQHRSTDDVIGASAQHALHMAIDEVATTDAIGAIASTVEPGGRSTDVIGASAEHALHDATDEVAITDAIGATIAEAEAPTKNDASDTDAANAHLHAVPLRKSKKFPTASLVSVIDAPTGYVTFQNLSEEPIEIEITYRVVGWEEDVVHKYRTSVMGEVGRLNKEGFYGGESSMPGRMIRLSVAVAGSGPARAGKPASKKTAVCFRN